MGRIVDHAGIEVVTGPDWPGVSYFCTTRKGGVSQGCWSSLNMGQHVGDDPAHVAQNRQRVLSGADAVFWLSQVHGTRVYNVDVNVLYAGRGNGVLTEVPELIYPPEADALVSARPGNVLAIMTADCLPVVLGSTDGRVVGVAHAGWRGLAGGVLENTVAALRAMHDGTPQWRAWIGPGIGPQRFEVGDDVVEAFVGPDADVAAFFSPSSLPGKWLADLSGIARHRLYRNGVSRVDVSRLCTFLHSDLFYSYRRDGVTGRMVTLVRIDNGA